MIHAFDLALRLGEPFLGEEEILDRLVRFGLDDAVVGLGRRGVVGLAFEREGPSATEVAADVAQRAAEAFAGRAILEETVLGEGPAGDQP